MPTRSLLALAVRRSPGQTVGLSARLRSPRPWLHNLPNGQRLGYSTNHEQTPASSHTVGGIQGGTVSEAIKHDHAELKEYYDQIMNAKDNDTKTRYQNQFTWELARHSIAEELVVYPAMEQYTENGRDLADKDRMEHHMVKELLYKFQGLSPTDERFTPTLQNLWQILHKHIDEEENEDLPRLEKSLLPRETGNLSKSFARTKMFVPTRSHPMAGDKPPYETVAGLMATPIDKLGDIFRKFPKTDETMEGTK